LGTLRSLLCRIGFVVGREGVGRDVHRGLVVESLRDVNDDVKAFFFRKFLHYILHLLGGFAENVLAITVEFGLQIVGKALRVALLALTLELQIGGGLLCQFIALQLLLDGLQVVLELLKLVLPRLVFGFNCSGLLLELVGVEHRLLDVDDGYFELGGGDGGERREHEAQQARANGHGTKHSYGTPQDGKTQVSILFCQVNADEPACTSGLNGCR